MYGKFRMVLAIMAMLLDLGATNKVRKDEKECEVCLATIEKFREKVPDAMYGDEAELEKAFRKFCEQLPLSGKENRFCYFVGGTPDAATGILGNLIRPFSYRLPSDNICEKLKILDPQICELRYDVKPDFANMKKMKIGDLRKVLSNWGEGNACLGCAEKADYIKVVRKLMPKYEPEEWQKLQEAEKSDL